MQTYIKIANAINQSSKITVLTGAGISTASGIPDFRSTFGLYDTELPVEHILSESYFQSNPQLFWRHYNNIFHLSKISTYRPNEGHFFLKELEDAGKKVTILTQNVDGLHHEAGSSNVYELHGTLSRAFCPKCKREYPMEHVSRGGVPRCEKDYSILKPDIVLFGGKVKFIEEAYVATSETEVFMVLGSSLEVYPVKQLPTYIQGASNIIKIIINKEATNLDAIFNYIVHDDINETFCRVKKHLLN